MAVNDKRITLFRDTAGGAHVAGLGRPTTDAVPAGYDWNYGGAGSAALARDILLAAGATAGEADRWHQPFKWALIAELPLQGARLNLGAMRRAVRRLRERQLDTEDCVKRLAAAAAPERLAGLHYARKRATHGRGRVNRAKGAF